MIRGLKLPSNPSLDSPLKVTMCLTARCNLDCRHCYADCNRADSPLELGSSAWKTFIAEAIEAGVISFFIEGGEPLLRPDCFELLQAMCPRALTRIRTNGTLITAALAHQLKAVGVGGVYLDFMGASPQTHDALAGVAGTHQLAREAVAHLLAVGLPVTPLIILNRANADEIGDFLTMTSDLGVREVGILRLYPIGRARRRWRELALSLDEQMHVIRSLRPPPRLRVMHAWHPQNGNCCWQMAAVDPYGRSIGCAYLRDFVDYGNVRDIPFLKTWDHPLYRTLRQGKVAETCTTCSAVEGTDGGCRATAFAFHGRWDAPDPFDEPLNAGVDLRELPKWMLEPDERAAHSPGA